MNYQHLAPGKWQGKKKHYAIMALLCCLLLSVGIVYSYSGGRLTSAAGITTQQCHSTTTPVPGAQVQRYLLDTFTLFQQQKAIGELTAELWYCFNYQSAFGRFTYRANADGPTTLDGVCWLHSKTAIIQNTTPPQMGVTPQKTVPPQKTVTIQNTTPPQMVTTLPGRQGCTMGLTSGTPVDTQITYGVGQTWYLQWMFNNNDGTFQCSKIVKKATASVYNSALATFCKTQAVFIQGIVSPTTGEATVTPVLTPMTPVASTTATATATTPTGTNPSVDATIVDILNTIKQNGYNAQAPDPTTPGGTLPGLFINWRSGTNPLQTNVNGTGQTDTATNATPRHDSLTDLRYLHNLLSYKTQHLADTSFDSEITRYAPIVRQEFNNHPNERGWTYDEFMDMYKISQSIQRPAEEVAFYRQMAMSTAQAFDQTFDPQVGTIFKKSQAHPQGSYRVDLSLEAGCALIEAGNTFQNQAWVADGNATVNFIFAHAYITKYHTFGSQMDNVLLPDGSVNPQETFFAKTQAANGSAQAQNTTIGNLERMGNISQIIIALLNAYQATKNQDLLNKATDLLDQFSLPANPLGMWDNANGGYYNGIRFTGTTPGNVSSFAINQQTKEAGRQSIMLQAFHLCNKFTNNHYSAMEKSMLDVALQHIYNSSTHGVPYLINADWTAPTFPNGTKNDMVTTEAMGAELESLLSLAM